MDTRHFKADGRGDSALPRFKKSDQVAAKDYPQVPVLVELTDYKPPTCRLAPPGWLCTRKPGHDGPCAAVKLKEE